MIGNVESRVWRVWTLWRTDETWQIQQTDTVDVLKPKIHAVRLPRIRMDYQLWQSKIHYENKTNCALIDSWNSDCRGKGLSHGIVIVVAKITSRAVESCMLTRGSSWAAGSRAQGVCRGWKQVPKGVLDLLSERIRKHNSNHQDRGIQAVLEWPEPDG